MTTYTVEIDMDRLVELTASQERATAAAATADYAGDIDESLSRAKDALGYANQIFDVMMPDEAKAEWVEKFTAATADVEYPEPPFQELTMEQLMEMLGEAFGPDSDPEFAPVPDAESEEN